MPLTDIRTATLPQTLRYTARFGLNRSQGTYFYQIICQSPPDTYLADLKDVCQPTMMSLLGRLLREASGTLPQLIPQEPVRDHIQSRRAWYNFEMKYGPSRTTEPVRNVPVPAVNEPPVESSFANDPPPKEDARPTTPIPVRESALPPLVTHIGFATSPTQLIPLSVPNPESPLTQSTFNHYQYPHRYEITNIRSSFTSYNTIVPLQDLLGYTHETFTHPKPVQQDDMESLPFSPMRLSDDDMDILADSFPAPPSYDNAWTQWNTSSVCNPAPPLYFSTVFTQQASVWQSAVPVEPSPMNQCSTGFAAPLYNAPVSTHMAEQAQWDRVENDLPGDDLISMVLEPEVNMNPLLPSEPTFHPLPMDVMSNPVQDMVVEMASQELPHSGSTPRSASIEILLGDPPRTTLEALPAMLDPASSNDRVNDSTFVSDSSGLGRNAISNSPRKPAEFLEKDEDQILADLLNLQDSRLSFQCEPTDLLEEVEADDISPPVPFKRELTEPIDNEVCVTQPSLRSVPLPVDPVAELSSCCTTRRVSSFVHARSPTPPPSRRYTKPTTSHDASKNMSRRLTCQSAMRTLPENEDHVDLAQASVQAGRRANLRAILGGRRLQPFSGHTHAPKADDVENGGRGKARKAALAEVLGPAPVRCGRRVWEEEEEKGEREKESQRDCREGKKRTRFVLPDPEDTITSSSSARLRQARMSRQVDTNKTAPPEPESSDGRLRSILRNKRSTRRGSIP